MGVEKWLLYVPFLKSKESLYFTKQASLGNVDFSTFFQIWVINDLVMSPFSHLRFIKNYFLPKPTMLTTALRIH